MPFTLGQPQQQSPMENKVGLSARMVAVCSWLHRSFCSFESKMPEAISEAWETLF